jgi:PKD repeat protein
LHLYPAPGIYSASLLAYATGTACEDSIRKFVVVKSYPTAGLSIPNNAGCPPITLDLIADNLSSAAIRYIWDMGNGDSLFGTPTSYTYNQSGNFTVTLTAIDNNNCKDDTSFSYMNVYPEQTPQASFTPRPGSQTILTPTIQFDNTTFSGIYYEWSFGDGKTGYDPSPSHTYPAIGEYVVQLIAQNHFGCVDTAIDTVYIYPEISVYVPNAFTPSGRNPYFLPRFADLDPTSYSFIICNRWGEKVFETNDPKQGWDGTYKGADAEVGVYVYVITTRSIQVGNKQENVSKRGTVTLLR